MIKKWIVLFLAVMFALTLLTFVFNYLSLQVDPLSPASVLLTCIYVFLFILLTVVLLFTAYLIELSLKYYERLYK